MTKTKKYVVLCSLLRILSAFLASNSNVKEFPPRNGTILIGFMGFNKLFAPPFQFIVLGSALPIALEKINNNQSILEHYTMDYTLIDDGCSRKQGLGAIVTLVKERGVFGIIGPACSWIAENGGYLASYWNVPIVAYSGTSPSLSDKSVRSQTR